MIPVLKSDVHPLLPGVLPLTKGYAYVSEAPGLGIDIDEALAKKHPLTPPSGKEDGFTVHGVDGALVRP